MTSNRRHFIKLSALGAFLLGSCQEEKPSSKTGEAQASGAPKAVQKPIVVSTWDHGVAANAAAWAVLSGKGRALDAVEAGVKVPEADPKVSSVGYGGLPDREGHVSLDACIMDHEGNCGAVAGLEHIMHPISVARQVMEKTPHAMLVGEGALEFALAQGFKKENLLTPEAEKAWKQWLDSAKYEPKINAERHDTIGMIALDDQAQLAGACTTSGLAYKMRGRIGDSPIIGAGLFVDSEVGAACATGLGESIIRVVGSHAVVELMRQGQSPEQACKAVLERLMRKYKDYRKIQVGFLALSKEGEVGAYALQKGFTYAVHTSEGNKLLEANYLF